jgi:hypothetical protein
MNLRKLICTLATRLHARRNTSVLVLNEFSSTRGGRRLAIDLLERGRGVGTGVVLAGQSAVALGDEDERARLLAAASTQIVFRTPQRGEQRP